MKKIYYITFLFIPFLLMIIVNETVRVLIKEKPYSAHGVSTINSINKDVNKCTWICHNNTNYCKEHHVKHLKTHFKYTDNLYFGIIGLLASTGNYSLANIIILVISIPFLIWYLLIKSINIQYKINRITYKLIN